MDVIQVTRDVHTAIVTHSTFRKEPEFPFFAKVVNCPRRAIGQADRVKHVYNTTCRKECHVMNVFRDRAIGLPLPLFLLSLVGCENIFAAYRLYCFFADAFRHSMSSRITMSLS